MKAQAQRIGGDEGGQARGHNVPHQSADHEGPHLEARQQEAQGGHERGDRRGALNDPLPYEVHAPEKDPRGRLQREGDRQVGQREHQRGERPVAVSHGHDGRQQHEHHREDAAEHEIDGEGALEGQLLVVVVLLDVLLVDPHLLQREQRDHRDRDDAVETDLLGSEQPGHHHLLDHHDALGQHQEGPVHDRPASHAASQLGAGEAEALGCHVPRLDRTPAGRSRRRPHREQ